MKSKFNYVIAPIAVVYTGFHIYTAFFGVLPSYLQRSIHLLFGAVLAFLIVKPSKEKRHIFWSVLNIFCSVVAFLVFGYFVWQNEIASEWVPFIKPFGNLQFIICVAATLLLLEATRRLVGLPLSICVLLFVSYGRYGSYFPGLLRHQGFTWKDLMEFLYFGFNGVYGMPIAASSTLIALFIIFGCFFEKTGGGAAIMTFGKYVIGHVRGGPAKIAVITSALFGTISGSAVANVYGTGTFTIPMMKKLGYDPTFAGAVEATGSTGGQIIPPVMGAAAFVMAEITGTPYSKIMVMALLPALLYYFSIFLMVDFEAARIGLRGFPRKELPTLKEVLQHAHHAVSLIVLVGTLLKGYSVMRAALLATVTAIVMSWVRKGHRLNLAAIVDSMNLAGRRMVMFAVATGVAGIFMGIVTLTGLGLNFVSFIMSFSGKLALLGALFTAIVTFTLGTGLASVVAYIIVAAVAIPALRTLGFDLLPCHMFIFYFSVLSVITPPDAPAVLAACELAGSSFFRTGWEACKLGVVAFVVPFMFIYSPALLMSGTVWQILSETAIATLAVVALSAGLRGWLHFPLTLVDRTALIFGALLVMSHKIIRIFFGNLPIVVGFVILTLVAGKLIALRPKRTAERSNLQ